MDERDSSTPKTADTARTGNLQCDHAGPFPIFRWAWGQLLIDTDFSVSRCWPFQTTYRDAEIFKNFDIFKLHDAVHFHFHYCTDPLPMHWSWKFEPSWPKCKITTLKITFNFSHAKILSYSSSLINCLPHMFDHITTFKALYCWTFS